MGAREYVAYDPNDPPVWRGSQRQRQRLGRRLLGWRYDAGGCPSHWSRTRRGGWVTPTAAMLITKLEPDAQGRLWSAALESWLAPDEDLLRLYDATGALRLTPDEAAAAQAQSERRARLQAEQRVTASPMRCL